MPKLNKSERKLSTKEKWILIMVVIIAIICALGISAFLQGLFIQPKI